MSKRTAKKGAGRKRAKKAKLLKWIFLSILTLLNILLSVLMRIADRKNAVAAIQHDEEISLLYTAKKTTKTL